MNFMPNDDAVEFGRCFRDFLAKHSPESALRELTDSAGDYDTTLWTLAARQLGVQGLLVAEEFGGSGSDLTTLGVCFEELGRALVCAPFFSTAGIAATALSELSRVSEDAAELLRGIANGSVVVAVAGLPAAVSGASLTATAHGIDGVAPVVMDGWAADCLLVVATDARGDMGLYLVPAPLAGVRRERLTALDSTRPLAKITFSSAPARRVAADARAVIDLALDTAWLLLAAEQLGGAQAVLDMALAYAKTRYQFSRPIGSFQAIKHRLAEMLVRVESARSVVYHALRESTANPESRPVEAALARATASEAFLACASGNIQIHGGIGFTWEHAAHLYLKRAKSSSLLFGDTVLARRRLAERLQIVKAAP
jgi:alkylation response protein AidB-like acyl-CoA dehydrogenase